MAVDRSVERDPLACSYMQTSDKSDLVMHGGAWWEGETGAARGDGTDYFCVGS